MKSSSTSQSKETATTPTPADWRAAFEPPSLSLPKGGGTVRGIGEKFSANPVTGTGSVVIPIAVSPGRDGFGPQLSLTYDSGAGNSAFGFGWQLSLPSITRRTDKGLPTYADAHESDVFVLSDLEDLVPVLVETASGWQREPAQRELIEGVQYVVSGYRPRIERTFSRIEKWTSADGVDSFWRTLSPDNVTTFYGRTADARVVDPADPTRVFRWLISESFDATGHITRYEYKRENDENVSVDACERHRADAPATAQVYPKRIRYGNTPSCLVQSDPALLDWLFEVVFDYGEGHYREEAPDADGRIFASASPVEAPDATWPARSDPFSTYRAAFEVRTYRLCQRVLMFHRFEDLGPEPVLVRSTGLTYEAGPSLTFLSAVTHAGYVNVPGRGLLKRAWPPVEFAYSPMASARDLRTLPVERIERHEIESLPVRIDEAQYLWVDLDGEGLSGVLTQEPDAWYYRRNRGGGRFAPPVPVPSRPSISAQGSHRLMDLSGDGQLDVVVTDRSAAGVMERTTGEGWERFVPFTHVPNVAWDDPNLRFLDLTGDGLADLVIAEHEAFVWYRSLGEEGFGASRRTAHLLDEERGPHVIFADRVQTIFLADMSGDGLIDLVRIRNGEVCYWPNLGYGRFGAKVTMDHAPCFDRSEQFDPARLRLSDIDGSGPADLIYLGTAGAVVYFNQSGNSWSAAHVIPQSPRADNVVNVQVIDLLGKGTACLTWSSPLASDAASPVHYIDLVSGQKPHLLVELRNNLGATTRLEYTPSTRFYLEDRDAGRPWVTRLPFPVHVVARVSAIDDWRGTTFSSTYSYHHGYFDGAEREFRGFGRVEQIDVEDFGVFSRANSGSPWVTDDHRLYQPPVKTITWFDTGIAVDRHHALESLEAEYFPSRVPASDGFREKSLARPVFPVDAWRDAARACKGTMLRQETYEVDVRTIGDPSPVHTWLFSATSYAYEVQQIQPASGNPCAVFVVSETESLTYQYEADLTGSANPRDPRISHRLTVSRDRRGSQQQTVSVAYPRRQPFDGEGLSSEDVARVRAAQAELHVDYVETRYTSDAVTRASAAPDAVLTQYRRGTVCEVLTHQLTGLDVAAGEYVDLDFLRRCRLSTRYPTTAGTQAVAVSPIAYHEQLTGGGIEKRLTGCLRSLFWRDDLTGPAPLGVVEPLGLKYEEYRLALTTDLLTAVFDARLDDDLGRPGAPGDTARTLLDEEAVSGYVSPASGSVWEERFGETAADHYWIRSGRTSFASDAREHFYLPDGFVDPFGKRTQVSYDGRYDLFLETIEDPQGNRSRIEQFDYRVLAARETVDINQNHSESYFDGLGRVIATAFKGKGTEGDDLIGFDPLLANPSPRDLSEFFAAQSIADAQVRSWLGRASLRFVYDFGEQVDPAGVVRAAARPASGCTFRREKHVTAPDGATSRIQIALECADGAGGTLMRKTLAEGAAQGDDPRWIVSGKTVLNNKGNAVKEYEPYFTDRFGAEPVDEIGVTPLVFYDALGRTIRSDFPDGTFSRAEFSPWHGLNFDANDTVTGSTWYQERGSPAADNPLPPAATADTRAAWLAARHASTPALSIVDSLGREVMTVAHNRVESGGTWSAERIATFVKLDAQGNPLWVRDARRNLVMQYITPLKPAPPDDPREDIPAGSVSGYDMVGNLLYQHNAEGGDRWTLGNAAGNPMVNWDLNEREENGNVLDERRMSYAHYDALRRPVALWMRRWDRPAGTTQPFTPRPRVQIERREYQDAAPDDATNLNGRVVRVFDPGGLTETLRRDFHGGVQEMRRTLVRDATLAFVDWSADVMPDGTPTLGDESYTRIEEFDALGRMTRRFNWHRGEGSLVAVYAPAYNARGLLSGMDLVTRGTKVVRLDGRHDYDETPDQALPRPVQGTRVHHPIVDVRYNARGQRESLALGNGTLTQYEYSPTTFALRQMLTTRPADATLFPSHRANLQDAAVVQQLLYTYDPVGNVTEIEDQAYAPVFWDNAIVEPRQLFEYDALYRLVSASGRETAEGGQAWSGADPDYATGFPVTGQTLRRYIQTYEYDAIGNFVSLRHAVPAQPASGWTQHYETAANSNRLLATWRGHDRTSTETSFAYDRHGNVQSPTRANLPGAVRWDYRDMIHEVALGGGGTGYYQYDSGKQRTRKRIVSQNGSGYWERIYFDGFERYRCFEGATLTEDIESHHLLDDDHRVLHVEDVRTTSRTHADGTPYRTDPLLRYQYGNHLGSVHLELDEAAAIIGYEEFHPYGSSAYRAMTAGTEAPSRRYRYAGMERDEESGFNYHHARYLAVWIGRWMSCDPGGFVGGLNFYAYANGNPLTFSDTEGLQALPREKPQTGEWALGEWNTRGKWYSDWFPEPVPDVWALDKKDYWEALAWRVSPPVQAEPPLSPPPLVAAPPPEPTPDPEPEKPQPKSEDPDPQPVKSEPPPPPPPPVPDPEEQKRRRKEQAKKDLEDAKKRWEEEDSPIVEYMKKDFLDTTMKESMPIIAKWFGRVAKVLKYVPGMKGVAEGYELIANTAEGAELIYDFIHEAKQSQVIEKGTKEAMKRTQPVKVIADKLLKKKFGDKLPEPVRKEIAKHMEKFFEKYIVDPGAKKLREELEERDTDKDLDQTLYEKWKKSMTPTPAFP